ncbi:MAG: SpoIIE family protein phosphatase [Nocardioidaceae bacterium]
MTPGLDVDDPRTWRADASHLDELSTPAVITDLEGHIVHCNAATERLTGRPRAQLLGADLVHLLVPESHHGSAREIFSQVASGVAWAGQMPGRTIEDVQMFELSASPMWRDGDVAGALFLGEGLVSEESETRHSARTGERLARLARVTGELVMADNLETVTKIVISHAADAAGATVASLIRLVDEDTLVLVGVRGADHEVATRWASFPVSAPTPAGDAVRTRRPVFISGRNEIQERYPDLETLAPGERSLVSLPLNVAGRSIGAIGLSFPGKRNFDSAELEFLAILADTCAQALDRLGAVEAASDRAAKLKFLADASAELSSSLDYQATLKRVAWLGVPAFADWCSISLLEDGELRTLEVAHVDPNKVAFALEMGERYPPDREAPRGAYEVVRTGRSELIPEITDEMLVAATVDEEHLRLARELNLRSAVTAPLTAQGRVLGVMSWVSADEGRRFTADDLSFVEDLAQRAAVAIDNSHLHSETREAAIRLQRAVLPQNLDAAPGWEFSGYYSPSGRTEVGGDFYDAIPIDGRVALVVGDVMGRGVAAAAAMAQIRAAVRAYVAIDPTPAMVLRKLDTMFAMFEVADLVTIVYMLADPATDEITVINAGHPPPLVLRADHSVEQLPDEVGAPLGTGPDGAGGPEGLEPDERTATVTRVLPGDTILLFTDGLIERRTEDIDRGQARLFDAVPMLATGQLGVQLAALVDAVRDHTREDDVAALCARRLPRA